MHLDQLPAARTRRAIAGLSLAACIAGCERPSGLETAPAEPATAIAEFTGGNACTGCHSEHAGRGTG